jgi:hypothetical protein
LSKSVESKPSNSPGFGRASGPIGAAANSSKANSPRLGSPSQAAATSPGAAKGSSASRRSTQKASPQATQKQTQKPKTQTAKKPSIQIPVIRPLPAAAKADADEVGFKPRQAQRSIVAAGLTDRDVARLAARGYLVEAQTKGVLAPRVVRLRLPQGVSLDQARRAVRVADAAATADLDHFYYTDEGAPGCSGAECEPVSLIGWNVTAADQCGAMPVIGVIDTGIDLDHEALKGQSIEVLKGPQGGSPSQRDHGTAVAALLVGRAGSNAPGLLPGGRVLAVDAFYRDTGTVDRTDVATLVAAMEMLAERGVRVINMSLSGPPNEVLRSAIEAAQAKGIVVVAAAGNGGAKAEPFYPAAYPGVIAVTAVDRQLNVYQRATHGDYIDLAAPGVELSVAVSGHGRVTKSGTSYAVPFISAAAAVMHATNPRMDSKSLRAKLEGSTRDLGLPGRDPTYGYGLIQMSHLCRSLPEEQPVAHSMPAESSRVP